MRRKTTAAILAFLAGSLGAHRFYLGEISTGLLYLAFCWTYIPALLALYDGIKLLTMTDDGFDSRYNDSVYPSNTAEVRPRPPHVVVNINAGLAKASIPPSSATTVGLQAQPAPATNPVPDYRYSRPRTPEEQQRFAILAARNNGGYVTVADLMALTQLTLSEANATLEALLRSDICELTVDTNSGALVYAFHSYRGAAPSTQSRMTDENSDSISESDLI